MLARVHVHALALCTCTSPATSYTISSYHAVMLMQLVLWPWPTAYICSSPCRTTPPMFNCKPLALVLSSCAQILTSQGVLTQADEDNISQRLRENTGKFLGLPGALECQVSVSTAKGVSGLGEYCKGRPGVGSVCTKSCCPACLFCKCSTYLLTKATDQGSCFAIELCTCNRMDCCL